ncbi:MAG: hypothetical protein ACPGIF_02660 [Flavobacteriales bacterium]
MDAELASASEDAATAMQKKALQIVNLAPSESIIEKLTEMHPMKQITYASAIQVTVLFGMFGCMAINQEIIKYL